MLLESGCDPLGSRPKGVEFAAKLGISCDETWGQQDTRSSLSDESSIEYILDFESRRWGWEFLGSLPISSLWPATSFDCLGVVANGGN